MEKIWWIIGGMVLTAIAFFIPERMGYIWPSVFSAVFVVAVFYVGLAVYIFKKGRSTFDKAAGIGILALFAGLTVYSAIFHYQKADWQHNLLIDIRKTIDQDISLVHVHEPLLKTLQEYHNQGRGKSYAS